MYFVVYNILFKRTLFFFIIIILNIIRFRFDLLFNTIKLNLKFDCYLFQEHST